MELSNSTALLDDEVTSRRRISLIPDVLVVVFSSLTNSRENDHEGWRLRNSTLASAALVSRDWSEGAYRELYGDLRLEWVGRRRKAIVEAFEANPALHSRVRKVTNEFVTFVSWMNRWYGSEEYEELRGIAEARSPTYDERGFRAFGAARERNAFLDGHRDVHFVLSGEAGWLEESAERVDQKAVDAFWVWAERHLALKALDIRSVEYLLPLNDENAAPTISLQDVLRHLRHVRIEGSLLAARSILPYLTDVKTLTTQLGGLDHPLPPLTSRDGDPPLRVLQKLQLTHSPVIFDFILEHVSLPNVAVLSFDPESMPHLSPTISSLPNLRSLHITGDTYHPDTSNTTTFNALVTLSSLSLPLSHLHLYFWPSPDILSALPATIQFLDFQVGTDINVLGSSFRADDDEVIRQLADVGTWRSKRFPALRAVGLHRGSGSFGWSGRVEARVEALVEEVEGFEVVTDGETWRLLLPGEWAVE